MTEDEVAKHLDGLDLLISEEATLALRAEFLRFSSVFDTNTTRETIHNAVVEVTKPLLEAWINRHMADIAKSVIKEAIGKNRGCSKTSLERNKPINYFLKNQLNFQILLFLISSLILLGCDPNSKKRLVAMETDIATMKLQLKNKKSDTEEVISSMNGEIAAEVKKTLFEVEKILLAELISLDNIIANLDEKSVIGIEDNEYTEEHTFLGRNQPIPLDKFIDLKKSFIVVGPSVSGALPISNNGRLKNSTLSRNVSISLVGVNLPFALESLAKSANLSVYLSPLLKISKQPVFLKMRDAKIYEIIENFVDVYDIVLAYDIEENVLRFFTLSEYSSYFSETIIAVKSHNQLVKLNKDKSKAVNQRQELLDFYETFFSSLENNNEDKIQNLSFNIDSYLTKNLSSMYLKIKEIVINSQSRVLIIKTSYLSVLKELEDDSKFLENLIENAELELQ